MQTTIIGPYPRVGTELSDTLRKEINASSNGKSHPTIIQQLREEATKETINELTHEGIDLINYGLIDVHDEISWPLEHVPGICFGGMRKIFHTNTHHKEIIVIDEINDAFLLPNLHLVAQTTTRSGLKIEIPGPYTLACHSKIQTKAYTSTRELAYAYAEYYREGLKLKPPTKLIQFNEPSIIARGREHPHLDILQDLYSFMLDGIHQPTAIWTYYGTYTEQTLDLLASLPVDIIGLDFVWDSNVTELLKKKKYEKKIGIGILDSGDRGFLRLEDATTVITTLNSLSKHIDLTTALLAPNATLEHLPANYARQKIILLRQIKNEVKQ